VSAAVAGEMATRKLRCSDCGAKDEFPAEFTQKDATTNCRVCGFHWRHSQDFDFHDRCPICIARFWRSRLHAIRILVTHPALLRSEER
jgi:uncharacterized Zn finger protein